MCGIDQTECKKLKQGFTKSQQTGTTEQSAIYDTIKYYLFIQEFLHFIKSWVYMFN